MIKIKLVSRILVIFTILISTVAAQQRSESDDFSYALKLYNEKFYDLAAQQFSRFVDNYPGTSKVAEAGFYGGMSLYYLLQYENARIEFQRVAVDFPRHDRAAESWYMIGECYQRLSNAEEAAKAYEMVKLLFPSHDKTAESILKAGNIYQDLGRNEVAEQLYNLIQSRYIESSSYFPSLLAQGKLYLDTGKTTRALEKLEKVLAGDSNDDIKAQAWYYLGESYAAQGNYQKAISPYQNVVNKYKKTITYHGAALSLSQIYLQQEKYPQVQRLVTDALKNNPPGIYKFQLEEILADAYYLNAKYALAGKQYLSSIESPDSAKYVLRNLKLALSWEKQGNQHNAIQVLHPIILEKKYWKSGGYHQAKNIYFKWKLASGEYESGIADLYTLQSLKGLSEDDQMWFVSFLKNQEDWLSIIRELQLAIYSEAKFTNKDNFIYEIAYANEQLGRYTESARFYQIIIEEYASSALTTEAAERLTYLRNYYLIDENLGISQLALLMGDVINKKEEALLQFSLGKIYYANLKDYSNALIQFKTALQTAQNQSLMVDIYHYIGLTYQRLAENRDVSEARRKELLNLAKDNLGKAMENIAAAADPDLVSYHFVALGIKADISPKTKQIGYYETLVKNYPESPIREEWYKQLGILYAQDGSELNKALLYYSNLVDQFPTSKKYPDYLYERAVLNLRANRDKSTNDFRTIAGSYPHSRPAANALYNLGLIWDSQASYIKANQVFTKVLTDYYYTDLAEKAKLKIGDTDLYSGESARAVATYRQLLDPMKIQDMVLSRAITTESQAVLSYKLGKAYYNLKDWNNARINFINYLANNPKGHYRSEASYLLGDLYIAMDNPGSAISSFENIPGTDDIYYPQALLGIANLYFDQASYDKAAENYKKLAAITSDEIKKADVLAREIICLIRSGKKSSADKKISSYSKAYKSQINHRASFQFEFGNYYRKKSNYNQAVKFFTNVKKNYPKSSYVDDAEYYLALTYIAVNRHQDAINILTGFAKKYPQSDNLGAVLNTLGGIYHRSEKYESAITTFKSAMAKPLKPEVRRQVMSNLIKSYAFVNFWDAALALSREYISTYPNADDVIDKKIMMGRAFLALNQVDRAVELFKETRLVADSEREPEIQFYIGDAYFQTGQYEHAIAEFVKIPLLSLKTELQWEASALYYSGQAYEKLGRIDEAKRMYSEIVKRPGIDVVLKKEAQKRIQEIGQ